MKWITQYEKGEFEVKLDTDELNSRLDVFNLAAQRLAVGMILLGMIIGSAFATSMEGAIFGVSAVPYRLSDLRLHAWSTAS